jgi:acyl-CoA synthetase (AMP-forming)/AMP-acid ligase II
MPETYRSFPAALRRHATADPESPFLFWAEGWNWRWWSWREVAALVARWAGPLAGLPPAARVGFAGASYPHAIALDLAAQAAGLTAVPLDLTAEQGGRTWHEALAARGCTAWLEAAAGEARLARLQGGTGTEELVGAAAADATGASVPRAEGGALVCGDSGSWRCVSPAELLAAAAAVESALAGSAHPSRGREILVAGRPLGEAAARLMAAWATAAGAALVLEPDPALRLAAVAWARPTVFYGSAAEVVALRQQVEARQGAATAQLGRALLRRPGRRSPRAPRPPFGRLRTLFQNTEPDSAEVAFWHARGARLQRLPNLDAAGIAVV